MQKDHAELNKINASNTASQEWIEERAGVVGIDGEFAEVLPSGQSACKSCSSNSGCSTNAFSFFSSSKKSNMRVRNTLNAQAGDEVMIGIPPGTLLMSTVFAYGIPLLLLFLAAFVGQFVFTYVGGNSEIGSMLFGGLGFLLGFVISSRLANIASLFKRYQPVILSINGQSVRPLSFKTL